MEPKATERNEKSHLSRRQFVQGSLVAAGATVLQGVSAVHAGGGEPIRICLVGCGKRGQGAVAQIMNSRHPTKIISMADAFADAVEKSVAVISEAHPDKFDVPPERRFVGFDAYKHAIDVDGVDLVVFATPPGFRPPHVAYAVEKKKHVFMEKPVAVDAPGVHSVLESTRRAKQQNTMLAVGLQRHHMPRYQETIKRLQDGAIGDILYTRAYWNDSGVWVRARKPGQSEMDYQMRNWYYFVWLCGDHILEQHIHNIDVINWLKGSYPVRASGLGGRQVRTGIDHGEIFDHFSIEFEYADGSHLYSQCCHLPGVPQHVAEYAHGSKGKSKIDAGRIDGENAWTYDKAWISGHQQEQLNLVDALVKGEVYNEGEYGAMSTMSAILGRMVAYSGQEIRMADALKSRVNSMPGRLAWDANPPTLPGADGYYKIPIPGQTQVL